jgi:dTDP-4-dehydrorhamnose reductase
MKKILILGKQSPLAVAIYELILKETDWKAYLELDNYQSVAEGDNISIMPIIYDKKTLRKIVLEFGPNYIINCLSYDEPEKCEEYKKEAWDFNVGTIEALSKAAFMTESKLIFFSTDNIYNGTNGPYSEDDLPNPLNYYGKTKLGCENYCISNNASFITVRLPEYYGNNNSTGSNIFYKIINNEEIILATNLYTTPVLLDDIAIGVIKIIDKNKSGFYNFSGPDYISEYDYGVKISEYLALDKSIIKPYTYSVEKSKIKKMLRGGLVNLKSEIDLNMNFVNLHSGLTTVRFQINYNS